MSTVAGTTPYPWPYDGVVDPARLALVVAGHDRRWSGRTPDPEATAERVDALGEALLAAGALVVRAAHRPAREAPGPAPGLLAGDPRVAVVHAAGTDAFYGSDLDALLRGAGRDHLLLAGFGLEGPVHSTLRSANDRGYECLLLSDCTGATDVGNYEAALKMVTMQGGVFGAVAPSAALLAALPAA